MMRFKYFVVFIVFLLAAPFSVFAKSGCITIDSKKTLKSQLVYKNSTYQIDDVIDLRGQSVTIPQNSILLFNGGSFKNGTIVGDNTFVQASPTLVFDNIELKGKWISDNVYPEWFGALANSPERDSRAAIQECLDVFNSVKLLGIYYLLTSGDNGVCLYAKEGAMIQGTQTPLPQDMKSGVVAKHKDTKRVLSISTATTLKNIGIRGNNTGTDRDNGVVGIYTKGSSRIHISDVQISNCGVAMECTTYLTLCERITAFYCIKGLCFHGSESSQYTSVSLNNCFVFSTLDYAYKMENMIYSSLNTCAADFIGYNSENKPSLDSKNYEGAYVIGRCIGVSLISCGSENCVRGLDLSSCGNIDVRSCRFTGAYSDNIQTHMKEYVRIKNCFHSNIGISIELRNLPKGFNYVSYSHYEPDSHNSLDDGMKSRMVVKSTGKQNSNSLLSKIKFE